MAYEINNSNPSPSSENTTPQPIQLDTFSSTRGRQTIPYKQFQKAPVPSEYDYREEEEEEDYDFEDTESVGAAEDYPSNTDMTTGGASNVGSSRTSGPSEHRRRRNTLLDNDDRGTQSYTSRKGSDSRRDGGSGSDEGKLTDREGVASDDDGDSSDEGIEDDEETGLTVGERKKKGRRKRRDTKLDNRIAGEASTIMITKEEKKEADQHVVKNLFINGILIGLWYLFSLSISIYNKWMFSPDHLDFHFPLFTTCMHMVVQFSLASLVLYFFPRFRPRYDSLSNPHNTVHMTQEEITRHDEESKKPLMTRWFYATRLGPCGMATGLDIGLGNMSLKFITLTFYTMVKSSSLAFVLIFAFIFRLEKMSLLLIAIIGTMTFGVILMVSGEAAFSLIGFILILSAAFFSGFRWALTQILLLRNPATSNPFASIFYLAPIMFLTLGIIALGVEGLPSLFGGLRLLIDTEGPIRGPLILLFPGVIAFCMTASEFALLQRTSVVTLSIAGIFKEVVTISAAALVFGDKMSPPNIVGLFVTIGAIAAYNYIKITKMREEARVKVVTGKTAANDANGGYFAVGDDEEDGDGQGDSMYVTADGDLLPKRPGGPNRIKSKDASLAPSIPGRS